MLPVPDEPRPLRDPDHVVRRLDAHCHVWDPEWGDYGWLTPDAGALYRTFSAEELVSTLQDAQVDAAILIQAAPAETETVRLLRLAESTSWVVGVVGWVDLNADNSIDKIQELARHPQALGIRPMLQDMPQPEWILAPGCRRALNELAAQGLTFDALVRSHQLPLLVQLARAVPELTIVLDHAGKPRIGAAGPDLLWRARMNELAALPNVFCKFSGLCTEASDAVDPATLQPWLDVLLESFGAKRLIWGSDWPVLTLATSYLDWITVAEALFRGLSSDERRSIWGNSARHAYRLQF